MDNNDASRSPELFVLTMQERRALEEELGRASWRGSAKPEVVDRHLSKISHDYRWSSHYLAFIGAYMEDEEVLPERDWELGEALSKSNGRLTTVRDRQGSDLDRLAPALYDMRELLDEFHGGGPPDDPDAEAALTDAMLLLRSAFDGMGPDDALVMRY